MARKGCRAAARRAASTAVSRVDYGPQFLVPVGVPRAEPSTVVCVRDAPQLRAEDRLVDVPVYPDFITEDEEQVLMGLITKKLGKEKYESRHFDSVIENYRECYVSRFPPGLVPILDRAFALFPPSRPPMRFFHALDLHQEGDIRDHVDHVEYSGHYVVGLCLLTDAVMTLKHTSNGDVARVYLPRRALYCLQGEARFEWGHAILKGPQPFQDRLITKTRRVSLIFRDEALADKQSQPLTPVPLPEA